jgi:hypothetical protein
MEDGASLPADLLTLPFLFALTFLAVTAVFFGWRRLRGKSVEERPPERPALGVPAAVGRLRAAGLDPDELLGPWLAEERRAAPEEQKPAAGKLA